jgi:uncharacterized protein
MTIPVSEVLPFPEDLLSDDRTQNNVSEESARIVEMATPCIKVCKLDGQNRCIGCGRTLQEIAEWTSITDAERFQIMDRLDRGKATRDNT